MISSQIQTHTISFYYLSRIHPILSCIYLIIIMEPFASEEKGLFTFYREQADFEEFLKQRKGQSKMQSQDICKFEKFHISKSEHEKKYVDKDRIHAKAIVKRSIHIKSPFQESTTQKGENIDLKDEEISSKILHLLQKNNPSSIPSENIKSIVTKLNSIEEQQKRKERNALKMKLYKDAKMQALKKKEETEPSNQIFIPKNDFPFKSNPFQKLAIQPRSFSSQLQHYKDQQVQKKIQHSYVHIKNKSKELLHASSQQIENQSPTVKNKLIRQLEAIDDLTYKFISQPLQKALPKINSKEKQSFVLKRQPYFNIINAEKIMNKYRSAEKMEFSIEKGRYSENKRYKLEDKSQNSLKDQIVLTSRKSMILDPTNAKFNIFIDSKKAKMAEMHLQQEKDQIFAQMMKKIHV